MVDKQTNFSKTRCFIKIINLTASICFVITPILRIMYRGFPAFETINDHVNPHYYLSNPLPFKPPRNVKRQWYALAKQVPIVQQGGLHKLICSKVAICNPDEGLYSTIRQMEVFRSVQEVVVLQKFQDPIPFMGVVRGPNWYILGIRIYCLALEKGNLLTWEWLRLNARHVDWLKKARPLFSVDCGIYLPMWSTLLRLAFNYLSFVTLAFYVFLRFNIGCLEWVFTNGISAPKEIAGYFFIPIGILLDRTKNILYPITKDTVKIIGSRYYEFIKESFPIVIDCAKVGRSDLYTLNNKILPILQKEAVRCVLRTNLILLSSLVSKTKIVNLLCLLKIRNTSSFNLLRDVLIKMVSETAIFVNTPILIEFLSPRIKILMKYVKASNITLTDLYTPINKKSIRRRNLRLVQQSKLVLKPLKRSVSIVNGFLILSEGKKLRRVIKFLKLKKIENGVRKFVKIKRPIIKQFIEIKTPILVNGFNENNQILINFLRKTPVIRMRTSYRDLTDPGIVDIVGSKMQLNLNIANWIRKETLILVDFLKTKTKSLLPLIILDIPVITQFIILDTPGALEFIKVELPGIGDLSIEKTDFRIVHEFLQKNIQVIGGLLCTINVLPLKFVDFSVKTLLRSYLLILLAESYLVIGDRSPLILILNIMFNNRLLFKTTIRLIDIGCELIIMWIVWFYLFPWMLCMFEEVIVIIFILLIRFDTDLRSYSYGTYYI
jgi:hypothetical protein